MNDYLGNLAARSLEMAEVIQPRRASRFEPADAAVGPVLPPAADLESGNTSQDLSSFTATPARHHLQSAASEPSGQAPITPAGRPARTNHELLHGSPTPLSPPLPTRAVELSSIMMVTPPPPRWPSEEPETADDAKSPRSVVEQSRQHLLRTVGLLGEVNLSAVRLAATTEEQPHRPSLQSPPAEPRATPPRRALTPAPAVVRPQPPLEPPTPRVPTAPSVNVTIGRIEVRAVTPAAPPPRRIAPPLARLSLDDYLKQREEGRR